jgi:hypothetical protein
LASVMGAMGLLAAMAGFSDTYRPAQLSDPAALRGSRPRRMR